MMSDDFDDFLVWPDGSYCNADEYNSLTDAWRGEDYRLVRAYGYDEAGEPIFEAPIPHTGEE